MARRYRRVRDEAFRDEPREPPHAGAWVDGRSQDDARVAAFREMLDREARDPSLREARYAGYARRHARSLRRLAAGVAIGGAAAMAVGLYLRGRVPGWGPPVMTVAGFLGLPVAANAWLAAERIERR